MRNLGKLNMMLLVSLVLSATGMCLLGIFSVVTITGRLNGNAEATLDERAKGVIAAFENEGVKLMGYSRLLTTNREVVVAVEQRDRQALRQLLVPAFQALQQANPTVHTMEVTDGQCEILLRGHNPEKFGDNKSATTQFGEALRQGTPQCGMDVSSTTGLLSVDAVVPLLGQQGATGLVKVGSYPKEEALNHIKQQMGVELLLYNQALKKVIGSTRPELTEAIEVAQSSGIGRIVFGDTSWLVKRYPLSFQNEPVRDTELLIAVDGTVADRLNQAIRRQTVVIGGLVLLGIGAAMFLLIRRIVSDVSGLTDAMKSSANHVAAAAEETAAGSNMLSETASEQASVVEETAASMEEISAQSQQTAELTRGSSELMKENIRKSGQSLKAMVELTQNMTDIERDSGQIRSIIGTIDSIAFQTNLLALNAAVEAARAGEAGAGFAVVASEVKTLAMKTTQESSRIQELLDATVIRITSCAGAMKGINNDFDGIVESATMIGDKNEAVTEAIAQQSMGITQVNVAANEIADTTQRIAAAAEQSAATAAELSAHSEELKTVVANLEKMLHGDKTGRGEKITAGSERHAHRLGHHPG